MHGRPVSRDGTRLGTVYYLKKIVLADKRAAKAFILAELVAYGSETDLAAVNGLCRVAVKISETLGGHDAEALKKSAAHLFVDIDGILSSVESDEAPEHIFVKRFVEFVYLRRVGAELDNFGMAAERGQNGKRFFGGPDIEAVVIRAYGNDP